MPLVSGMALITSVSTRLAETILSSPVFVSAAMDPEASTMISTLTVVPAVFWATALE